MIPQNKKSSWPAVPIGRLSTILPMVGIFVYYKNMKFNDQFTITLTSAQHDLLTDIFSSLADLDLPPAEDDQFDSLWDQVINADHKIITEESWARSANSIQVSLTRDILKGRSESLPKDTSSGLPLIGSTGHTKNTWITCTIFWTVSKTVLFLSKPGGWIFLFQFVTSFPIWGRSVVIM